ncbi:MAG: [FeFe] hydrogenase H-cluster radical SAM maturase HydE [Syntrophaceae bacterium]|nr:[FeFe] hydrogenase H-cluster radical SAM maturase HydE [Syntrophaceae bacterium]
MSISDHIEKLLLMAEIGKSLSREDIVELLKMPAEYSENLFATADRVRKNDVGDEIYIRGIIDISNVCERNCLYCGLRKANEKLERYRMSEDEILETVREMKSTGIGTVVLQSGEDSHYSAEDVCHLVRTIKEKTDLVITLSIGERSPEEYRAFFEAGADRYLLKHETASTELYNYLRPGCRLDKRVSCLKTLKDLGFETGTGNMVGLPGQTYEILADDLLLMKILKADMLGIGPFIAHPDTPLAGIDTDDIELTLRVLAVARLLTRNTNIPATTAVATLHPQGRLHALQAGANVVMLDFTPPTYRNRYDIYPGKTETETVISMMKRLEGEIHSLGRIMNCSAGYRRSCVHDGILH